MADFLQKMFGVGAKTEKAVRSERFTELARQRKEGGLAYAGIPTGKKIVQRNGVKHLEWDVKQLAYIAEIAERLPKEGAEAVAKDFWRRRIKDRRGRLWGKQVLTDTQQVTQFLGLFLGRSRYRSPYEQFYRAARWFHRMKWEGLLPEPFLTLAKTLPEPKGFGEEPKPKGWTPGGTARRERERAARRAERLVRWQKEKEARAQARVHKPGGPRG